MHARLSGCFEQYAKSMREIKGHSNWKYLQEIQFELYFGESVDLELKSTNSIYKLK